MLIVRGANSKDIISLHGTLRKLVKHNECCSGGRLHVEIELHMVLGPSSRIMITTMPSFWRTPRTVHGDLHDILPSPTVSAAHQ